MNKKYKLIIFDWDGTLMDSISVVVKNFQATARDMNIPVYSAAKIRGYIGLNMADHLEQLYPGVEKDDFISHYDVHRNRNLSNMPFYSGAVTMLDYLRQQGYTLAVATSKYRRDLNPLLDKYKIADRFAAIRCGDDGFPKPDPGMIWSILEELDITKEQAIMVGDSEYDMELAKNAGVDAVAVSYGAQCAENLLRHKPIHCIADINELTKLF